MNEIQEKCFEILQEIDRVCKCAGLTYYLYAGTLLGAVRHRGFIPWDDDIDIVMPRSDYHSFVRACSDYLDIDKYELQTVNTDPVCNNPWMKLHSKNTAFISGIRRDSAMEGINVDIFPIDNVPNSIVIRNLRGFIIDKLNFCYFWRFAYRFSSATLKMRLFRFVISFIPPLNEQKFKYKYNKYIQRYNDRNTKYVVYLSNRKYARKVIPRAVFDDAIYLEFEGNLFPCPKDYKEVLKRLYGDNYMQPPTVENQTTVHGACVVDLNNSWRTYRRVDGKYEKI